MDGRSAGAHFRTSLGMNEAALENEEAVARRATEARQLLEQRRLDRKVSRVDWRCAVGRQHHLVQVLRHRGDVHAIEGAEKLHLAQEMAPLPYLAKGQWLTFVRAARQRTIESRRSRAQDCWGQYLMY